MEAQIFNYLPRRRRAPAASGRQALLTRRRRAAAAQEEVRHELASGKAFLQGVDRRGRPVLVVRAAAHDMAARDLAETRRFVCYVLDAAAAAADAAAAARRAEPPGLLCLFDLSGAAARPRCTRKGARAWRA